MPGILTGTIIGLAKALGETAPLLMIGMVAFVVEYPTSPMAPSTALPVQIYMWATSAERGFVERTAGATIDPAGGAYLHEPCRRHSAPQIRAAVVKSRFLWEP